MSEMYSRLWISRVLLVAALAGLAPVATPAADPLPYVLVEDTSVSEGGTNAVFTFRLLSSNALPVTVAFTTGDYTAIEGQDYQATNGTVVFPPGVFQQTLTVPVFDDSVWEAPSADQFFFLLLTSATNAEIFAHGRGYILDNDPAPQISVLDAPPVVEGDTGTTNAVFEVRMWPASDWDTQVDFASAEFGYPQSWSDIIPTAGTVIIPARATNAFVNVAVRGDTIPEAANKVFFLDIANPYPFVTAASLVRARAQGTMLDDDTLPGKLSHFQITAIPSPQLVERPFPVIVTAMDGFNQPITNYADAVTLTVHRWVGHTYYRLLEVPATNFIDGVSTNWITLADAATNVWISVWDPLSRSGLTGPFNVIAKPTLFLSVPGEAIEGDGLLAGAGQVSLTNVVSVDLVINLSPSDPVELTVPELVTIPAGQTSVVFNVTILDDDRLNGSRALALTASSPGYLSGARTLTVHDNESAKLSVTLPPNPVEGAGYVSGQATVSVSRAPEVDVAIYLVSSDLTELGVPSCCTIISAGQTSTTFPFTLPDDNLVDGPQTVSVTASVTNWIAGTATAIVLDNDTNLTVSTAFGNKSSTEGEGNAGTVQVRLNGIATTNILVNLASSDSSELIVPPALVILAGQQSGFTNLFLPDDAEFDGDQIVVLTATADGLAPGTRTLVVHDDDVHHITFSALSASQTSGVPFSVIITARDTNDVEMLFPRPILQLLAINSSGPLALTPTNTVTFIRGNGQVTLLGWGTAVRLVAAATNGVTGQSHPFNVAPPAWASTLRISRLEIAGADVRVTFPTVSYATYQLEWALTPLASTWTAVETPVRGTGNDMTLQDPGGAAGAARFYRLRVAP